MNIYRLRKNLFLICITLITTSFAPKSDFFEGVIIYRHEYDVHSQKFNAETLSNRYGNESIFYFKNGNYKQLFNGSLLSLNIYQQPSNVLYIKFSTLDTFTSSSMLPSNEVIKTLEIEKGKEKILNYDCDMLKIETNDLAGTPFRKAYYYFNSALRVNPDWYSLQGQNSNKYIYAKTKALALKIIIEKPDVTVTMTAIGIKNQSLADSTFQLP